MLTYCFNYRSIVVAQAYKVDVEILAASRGCTAILRCIVPNFVKELVRVVSWVQEPAFYIYPSLQGGKYSYHIVSSVSNLLFVLHCYTFVLARVHSLNFNVLGVL